MLMALEAEVPSSCQAIEMVAFWLDCLEVNEGKRGTSG